MNQPRECWADAFEPNDKSMAALPLWREIFSGVEAAILHIAPIYWGLGAEHGNGEAVVVLPGFLVGDVYLTEIWAWLYRMNYKPYFSGIRVNAECPNMLIRRTLNETITRARKETGRKVHLIGHSLGGVIALSTAGQRPQDIASVTTLGSPFRGVAAHPNILWMAEQVRKSIQTRHGKRVLPHCYTGHCTCNFVNSLTNNLPEDVQVTAIYSRTDGVVDWHSCVTGDPHCDFEIPGTHIGMVFNSTVYQVIARRLAEAERDQASAAAPTIPGRTATQLFVAPSSRPM